jgi:polyhydroxyalkanoate synthesis regulator phasin
MRISRLLPAVLASALLLTACGEEQAADTSQRTEEGAPAQPEPDKTEDAVRELREAGEALKEAAREGAQNLAEQGREALKDAGPALERAGEIARDIGQSVEEIIKQAQEDFDSAVTELEKRIDEAAGTPAAPNGDPDAVLAPADQLNADTRAAARARPAGIGPDYVGVWAADAAFCARIDAEPVELFAVITPTTIRRYESVCNFDAADLKDGEATVTASCIAEGDTEERQIKFAMQDENALRISTPGADGEVQFVRCHLRQ